MYNEIEVSRAEVPLGEPLTLRAKVHNEGPMQAEEVVQLYVRKLKGFRRVRLVAEPGAFRAWIGGGSDADLQAEFSIIQPMATSPVLVERARS